MMRHSRKFAIGVGLLVLVLSGCAGLDQHRRSAQKDAPPDMFTPEPTEPAKAEKKTGWSPGSWSSEARDIEKNMMRTSPNANW